MAFNTLVKQVEANIGGGIRISVYKQIFNPDGSLASEEPHRISIGPFDDFDQTITENNTHLQRMGYPVINPDELSFVTAQRGSAHSHPITQEIMRVEAEKIEAKRAADEIAAREVAKAAAKERQRLEAEADADRDARKQAFDAAVSEAVDKALAKVKA